MKINRRKALKLAGSSMLLAMPFVQRAKAEDAVLNVYNWADYIGETTIEDFQKETGIKVTYDTYSSTDEMQAKMLAGSTGYDVVTMAGLSLQRFIKAKIYTKIDKSKLPSIGNLDPTVLKIAEGFDPGQNYGIPYMWGSVGFTYNLDMLKERLPGADLESMDVLMKPENAAKLKDCGISILDEPTDVIPLIMNYLGFPHDDYKPEHIKAAVDAFKKIRKNVRAFDSTNYLNLIPNKELCVINNWSGDYSTAKARAKDAGVDINLGYFVPKTGAPAWIDFMCIPQDAANKDNAYKFLEYLLQPEVIAKCTNLTNYANANAKAAKFVNPDVLSNPAVYPDEKVMKRLYTLKPLSEDEDRALTQAMTAIKSG
ncbi:MAG: polyamine ABC transporter substrate-binding protein [Aestuariivirga sp.]